MSPQQQAEAQDRARAFIDQVVAINQQFGMGVVPDAYDGAVAGSAAVAASVAAAAQHQRR